MKKTLLLLVSMMVALGMTAQENLALSATPSASSINDAGTSAANANDNNTGTRWIAGDPAEDPYPWLQYTWTEAQTFNTVEIVWEGAYSKQIKFLKSDDGENFTEFYTSTSKELSGFPNTQTYTFDPVTTKYLRYQVVEHGTGYRNSFWEMRVYNRTESLELTTIEVSVSKPFAAAGENITITVAPKDQYGNDYEVAAEDIALTVQGSGTLNGNVYTAGNANEVAVITATVGEVSGSANVATVLEGAPDPTVPAELVSAVYSDYYSATTVEWANGGWNWGAEYGSELDFDGNKAKMVTRVGTAGLNANRPAQDYDYLHLDIYSVTDINGYIQIEGCGPARTDISLKAGQWNAIELTHNKESAANATWIQIYLGANNSDKSGAILIDNVYFAKIADLKVLSNENGVAKLAGVLNADSENDIFADASVTTYDLTGVAIDEDLASIELANPNAYIIVSGKLEDGDVVTELLPEQNNVIIHDTWYMTNRELHFTPGYNVNTDITVDANNHGAQGAVLEVNIPAGAYKAVAFPLLLAIPEGVEVLAPQIDEESGLLVLAATTIAANKPVVLHNTGDADITSLQVAAKTDLTFKNPATLNDDKFEFVANYAIAAPAAAPSRIDLSAGASYVVNEEGAFVAGEAQAFVPTLIPTEPISTGINNVAAAASVKGNVYTIDGRIVKQNAADLNGLARGIYIHNGKKVMVQ